MWPTGCVAESAADLPASIRALVRQRGRYFEGGIVLRPFLRLRDLGESPFGGRVYEEYRLFFLRGRLLAKTAYDRVGGDPAGIGDYAWLPGRIRSPFFSADVVVTEEGQRLLSNSATAVPRPSRPNFRPETFTPRSCVNSARTDPRSRANQPSVGYAATGSATAARAALRSRRRCCQRSNQR